jgi:hypothetical protein
MASQLAQVGQNLRARAARTAPKHIIAIGTKQKLVLMPLQKARGKIRIPH